MEKPPVLASKDNDSEEAGSSREALHSPQGIADVSHVTLDVPLLVTPDAGVPSPRPQRIQVRDESIPQRNFQLLHHILPLRPQPTVLPVLWNKAVVPRHSAHSLKKIL